MRTVQSEEEREEARLKIQKACEEHNEGLTDRAAKRRLIRALEKAEKKPTFRVPYLPDRATRRHPAPALSFEPDPNAEWRGRRMFLQRDKKIAEGRV